MKVAYWFRNIKGKYSLYKFRYNTTLWASSFSLLVQRKRSKRNDTFFKVFLPYSGKTAILRKKIFTFFNTKTV